jgi:hypothetical protein
MLVMDKPGSTVTSNSFQAPGVNPLVTHHALSMVVAPATPVPATPVAVTTPAPAKAAEADSEANQGRPIAIGIGIAIPIAIRWVRSMVIVVIPIVWITTIGIGWIAATIAIAVGWINSTTIVTAVVGIMTIPAIRSVITATGITSAIVASPISDRLERRSHVQIVFSQGGQRQGCHGLRRSPDKLATAIAPANRLTLESEVISYLLLSTRGEV